MLKISIVKALNTFFNSGENKKSVRDFQQELKALSTDEKAELGTLAAEAMGMQIETPVK